MDLTSQAGVTSSRAWLGRSRRLAPNRWIGAAFLCAMAVLATTTITAAAYLIFHDPLLASLMARQAMLRSADEEQILALKAALDQRSRNDAGKGSAALLALLKDRERLLETRADAVDALMAQSLGVPAAATATRSGGRSRTLGREPACRAVPDATDHERAGADPCSTAEGARLHSALSDVEGRQTHVLTQLRTRWMRHAALVSMALAKADVPAAAWPNRYALNVGGPFVPLDATLSGSAFDDAAALLQSAIAEDETLGRVVVTVPLRRPLAGPIEVTSTFGPRLDPFFGRPAMHTGLDLLQSANAAVEATASGVVTIAGPDGGYGNLVEIDHGNGLSTRYAHLASISVTVRQKVAPGTIVGWVGATGRATGPHLHYETRVNGQPVDPTRFLKAGLLLFPN